MPKYRIPDFMNLTRDLCELPTTGISSKGNDDFFARVGEEIPLRIFRYPSGSEYNGWVVPHLWELHKAKIRKNGKEIYDGTEHVLGTAHYSRNFSGSMGLEELKKHLFFSTEVPDAHIWHCAWAYRPWEEGWGFCPPKTWIDQLTEGEYEVEIEATLEAGEMLVGDYHIKGKRPETIVFNTNNCHPHMANDGFAGTAVMIRLFQWLADRENNFSYRLVICPEHIGSVHYLTNLDNEERDNFVGGVVGEMMGTQQPFTLGATFWGDHYLDAVFRHIVPQFAEKVKYTPFRQNAGNDETVWEAPGYEIPFIQTVRVDRPGKPFPEYHSELDTPDLMNPKRLSEFYTIYQHAVELIENNAYVDRQFEGLIALSNPKYDLYVDRVDPSKPIYNYTTNSERWGHFQDCVFRYLDGKLSVLEMADRHGIGFFELKEYLERWENKGLVTFRPFYFDKTTTMTTTSVDISLLSAVFEDIENKVY